MLKSAAMKNAGLFLLMALVHPVNAADSANTSSSPAKTWQFTVPADSTIPDDPLGASIRLGRDIAANTQLYAKAYVGNGLQCSSCHLNGGTVAGAAPFVGLWGVFPEYRTRSSSVNSLQERINDCFKRSMNGKPLPEDSPEMMGMLSYIWWLSQDVPTGTSVAGRGFEEITASIKPDINNGKVVYAQKCASCHGVNGEGMNTADGGYMFPALWGDKSFNIGAGMARLSIAAAFVKHKMPLGQGNTLTDQEAVDVAAYFTVQPRPDFAEKSKDWANGGKPVDARY